MNEREFFTGYNSVCRFGAGALLLSGDDVHGLLLEHFPAPALWSWPSCVWTPNRTCDLLYLARGPGRTLKIGLSGKPADRLRGLSETKALPRIAERLGCVPGAHRLVVAISKGTRHRKRCLLDLVASERISGEWSRGPLSELLIATLAGAAEFAAGGVRRTRKAAA